MKKITATILLLTTIITCMFVPVGADGIGEPTNVSSEVMPRWNNAFSCDYNFYILTDGTAKVTVDYSGTSGAFTNVTVTTYIQKRFLGIFWTTVDIGQPDNKWIDTSTSIDGRFVHTVSLSNTGTYRAVIKVVFSGTGGADDVIEDKIEATY